MKTYLVTSAVNKANLHKGFWASLQHAAKHKKAEIVVVGTKYKNPTQRKKTDEDEDTYAVELLPFLTRKRRVLGPNLTLFADIPIQPTSSNPTSGLEVLAKEHSAIVGHVTRRMQVVPTSGKSPRLLWTTSSCTKPSYSKSRAGARAKEHHIIGALVVEVVGKHFWIRNVTAKADGSFTDLDHVYMPNGVERAPPALAVVGGDIHVGQSDIHSIAGLRNIVQALKPKWLVLHDVLDFRTRSHHRADKRSQFESRHTSVELELAQNADFLADTLEWGASRVAVVASNHDEHLGRWLEEHDVSDSPRDAKLYHRLWHALLEHHDQTGAWLNPYEQAMADLGVKDGRLTFLKRGEQLKVANVNLGNHGDKGLNGARGSLRAFTKMGSKEVIAHAHTPGVWESCFQVGTNSRLDLDYTVGSASGWLHADVVVNADGSRQMIVKQGARYRA